MAEEEEKQVVVAAMEVVVAEEEEKQVVVAAMEVVVAEEMAAVAVVLAETGDLGLEMMKTVFVAVVL